MVCYSRGMFTPTLTNGKTSGVCNSESEPHRSMKGICCRPAVLKGKLKRAVGSNINITIYIYNVPGGTGNEGEPMRIKGKS